MKFLKAVMVLFALGFLSACGGGGGGGGGSTPGPAVPVFDGSTAIISSSASSASIGLPGDTATDEAVLTFEIKDSAGTSIPDGAKVDFAMLTRPRGGEKLSADYAYTKDGKATVVLKSGTASGPVEVQATYYDVGTGVTHTHIIKVTIVSGTPDVRHLSIAVEKFSLDATVFGLEDTISAYLGDRYGNVIDDGTPVSFITEGGTIGTSSGFNTTTISGVATATLRTANPTTPALGGIVPVGNPGRCRVVVYTSGSESFEDLNGDGVYTAGVDRFVASSDMSEPYIDANDSGQYEVGELYIDADGNGQFTPANGVYDAKTTIWTSGNVVFSAGISVQIASPVVAMKVDSSKTLKFTVSDQYGNTPLDGTKYDITTTYKEAKFSNKSPESPLKDNDGAIKTVSFTVTTTDKAVVGDTFVIRVAATLPNGTQSVANYTVTVVN